MWYCRYSIHYVKFVGTHSWITNFNNIIWLHMHHNSCAMLLTFASEVLFGLFGYKFSSNIWKDIVELSDFSVLSTPFFPILIFFNLSCQSCLVTFCGDLHLVCFRSWLVWEKKIREQVYDACRMISNESMFHPKVYALDAITISTL